MSSLRRALAGLALLGLAWGLAALFLILTSDHMDARGVLAAVTLFVGWSFIGTGLFAWWRRPRNRFGGLMTAVGFAWLASMLVASNVPAIFVLGILLNNIWIVLLAHALLAYPSGRLETRRERRIVAGAWVAGVLLQIPPTFFLATPDADKCDGCPTNPLLIADSYTTAQWLFVVQGLVGIFVLVSLVLVLVRRWRAATVAQREALGNVLWLGVAAMILFSLQLAVQTAQGPQAVASVLFLLSLAAVAAVPYGFLAGLLRSRFSRAEAVNELVERIGFSPAGGAALRDALADALADPSLMLAYWLPARARYVDADGHAVELPATGSGRASSIVERDGRPVAAIVHDKALLEEPDLIRTIGAAAALRLENERLDAELRAKLEELRDSRARIVKAADEERRRLERDLHDGAQQRLVALAITLRLARRKMESEPEQAATLIDEAADELAVATEELRELARGIHPAVLTDRGLGAALDALVGRAPVPVEIAGLPDERLPPPIESATYFVVAEALTNVARYAEARHARVEVVRTNGRVTVEVRDDGIGGANPSAGSGLRGLADRVAALDGRLEVLSPPGEGTVVRAEVPCE